MCCAREWYTDSSFHRISHDERIGTQYVLITSGGRYSRINGDLPYVGMGYGFYFEKKINIQLGKQVVIVINTF